MSATMLHNVPGGLVKFPAGCDLPAGPGSLGSGHVALLYRRDGPIATNTFNRPEQPNTAVPPMPDEFGDAIVTANRDDDVVVKQVYESMGMHAAQTLGPVLDG
jgi:hypothetical protein